MSEPIFADVNEIKRRLADASTIYYFAEWYTMNESIYRILNSVATVDAVQIVRCKDCRFRNGTPGQPNILCRQMKDDDYCSYGERNNTNVDQQREI